MTPGEAIRRLAGSGVTAAVKGDQVSLAPGSHIPRDLLPELREIRDDLLEALAPITYEVVQQVPDGLRVDGPLGFDVETTGLRPAEDELRLIQLTADGRHVYVFESLTPELASLLNGAELVAHNATFDVSWLLVNSIEPRIIHCTQIEAFDAGLGLGPYLELEVLAKHVLEMQKPDVDHSGWAVGSLTAEQLEYAAFDAAAVHRINRILLPMVSRAYPRHRRLIVPTARAQLAGLPVDDEELEKRYSVANEVCTSALGKVVAILTPGKKPKKAIPKKAFVEYTNSFLDAHPGVDWPRTPKSNEPTMKRDWMKTVAHLSPVFKLVHEFQSRVGVRNAYRALRDALCTDGRVRGSFNICGTVTGRYSSSSPNLQNLQPEVREVVRAEDGWHLLSVDYSQIEPRVMATLSGDEAMLECARTDDLYRAVARRALGREDITEVERSLYKVILLAMAYGESAKSLAGRLNTTLAKAREVQRKIRETFPKLQTWLEEIQFRARVIKRIETVGGTVRTLPSFKDSECGSHKAYAAQLSRLGVNTVVQGGAADVFCEALIRSDEALRDHDAEIVGLLHDELIVHCREPSAVGALLSRVMVEAVLAIFPDAPIENIAEPVVGTTWADLK